MMHVLCWNTLLDSAYEAEEHYPVSSSLQVSGCQYHRHHHRPNGVDR